MYTCRFYKHATILHESSEAAIYEMLITNFGKVLYCLFIDSSNFVLRIFQISGILQCYEIMAPIVTSGNSELYNICYLQYISFIVMLYIVELLYDSVR